MPDLLLSMGSQRVRHEVTTEQQQQIFNFTVKKKKLSKLYISLPNVLYALLMSGNRCLSWEIANGNEITAGCSDIMCTFKPRKNKNIFLSFFYCASVSKI